MPTSNFASERNLFTLGSMSSPLDHAPPEIAALSHFLDSLNKESDRGAALVAASMVDEVILNLLRASLIECTQADELLTGFHAPLGTFSARILAAYSLGLIEKREMQEAQIIRKIRNEFGHAWDRLSFDSPQIFALVQSLPELLTDETRSKNETRSRARNRFDYAVINLLADWLWRERFVRKERHTARVWEQKKGFRPDAP
jgi:hypothetical protein